MSDELNKAPETEQEEVYEGILGDYEETNDAEAAAADTAESSDAPKEKKPAGKKGLAIAGICAAVLAVGGLGTFGVLKYREVMPQNAAVSDHNKVTDRMAAYYLQDALTMYKNYYGEDMLLSYYGLDVNASLKEQESPMGDGSTWFDTLIDSVKSSATQYLVLKEAGDAMGYKLTDADRKTIDDKLAAIDLTAYGDKMTLTDARRALELQAYAAGVYNEVYEGFTFTDEEIEAYLETSGSSYITCGLMGFSISYDTAPDAAEDETPAEDEAPTEEEAATSDEETVSDEEAAAADEDTAADEEIVSDEDAAAEEEETPDGMDQATAAKLANSLKASKTPELFESVVSDILTEYEGYSDEELESLLPTIRNDSFSYMTGNELGDWAFGGEAKAGDTLLIEGDGVYYVYLMTREPSRDDSPTVNVRHILFETSEHTGDDGDEAAALEECHALAQAALDEWKNGDATEDSFGELAERVTEDPGSKTTGGLYENVTEGQMVQAFNDWCFDESRQPGDTGIVETEYGVHVMYFVGTGDPLWKAETITAMRSEQFQTWYNEQTTLYPVTINDEIFATVEG